MDLKWQNAEDIAIRLVEEHPESDPLTRSEERRVGKECRL